jgi:hypothetical protein
VFMSMPLALAPIDVTIRSALLPIADGGRTR